MLLDANTTTRNDHITRWGIGHPPRDSDPLTDQLVGVKALERCLNNWGLVSLYYS